MSLAWREVPPATLPPITPIIALQSRRLEVETCYDRAILWHNAIQHLGLPWTVGALVDTIEEDLQGLAQ
jgi:hypothetical protein